MKKLMILFAAAFALAACQQKAPEAPAAAPAMEEAPAAAPAAPMEEAPAAAPAEQPAGQSQQ
ncbi:MAG TPA: hypothetical protein VGA00_14855 [Acidiferrobacterales bacterium]